MSPAAQTDRRHEAQSSAPARALGAATLGLTLLALAATRRASRPRVPLRPHAPARPPAREAIARRNAALPSAAPEARQLYSAAAMLAASVLSDSALEHYRGGFENPGMFTPLASSALVLASALQAAHGPAAARARTRDPGRPIESHRPTARSKLPFLAAAAVGLAGLGFHVYNVLRRPGGLSWGNLFYAAPLGAPAALSLAGAIGLAARQVETGAPTLLSRPSGQALCALAAFGLAGTTVEAALLHFRGAFQHPAMWLPVTVPPVGAALLMGAALRAPQAWAPPPTPSMAPPQPHPPGRRGRLTHLWLRGLTWLGLAGMGFHARGVARQMGGWRNWSQNLLSGPPLPAPPSFSALALAGQAALALRARDRAPAHVRAPLREAA